MTTNEQLDSFLNMGQINDFTTTKELIKQRKAAGDSLVTKTGGYSFGTTSGDGINGYQLGCRKYEPHTYKEIGRDPMDGHCFPTYEDAEAYGLEAGHLIWFGDWKAQNSIS